MFQISGTRAQLEQEDKAVAMDNAIVDLPDELWFVIFSKLLLHLLFRFMAVSETWSQLAMSVFSHKAYCPTLASRQVIYPHRRRISDACQQ